MAKRKRPTDEESDSEYSDQPGSPPELVVIMKPSVSLRATPSGLSSLTGVSTSSLSDLLQSSGATMTPLFGNEDRIARALSVPRLEDRYAMPDLSSYYKVEADEELLQGLAERLLNESTVDGAYVKPPMYPPVMLDELAAPVDAIPPVSPDFGTRQIYLDAAPAGIDARFAWTVPGGRGQGVRIIDIEGAWRFSHEDLLQNQGGVIGGVQSLSPGWRNHGTAVVGEFGADDNVFGVTGICPEAIVRAISIFGSGQSSSKAITDAANALSPGDIILIELHAPGPRHNFQDVGGQLGFIAVEFWPADFAAILYATSVRGVIVVEAAGNGAENLDDPLYDNRPAGFPSTWRNPFNLTNPQSGAVLVGAGAPPPGTHGRNHGPDRSRLGFSNYGARVDTQGWGREVTTTAYGDLQGGTNEDFWYTDTFSGTSSASPIVVGAIGCAQGARRAAGQALLTPATAQNVLRTTGSPQQASPTAPVAQRIGNRPNLRQMISQPPQVTTAPLFRYWNPNAGDHFYTTNWGELGPGQHGWRYESVQCHVLSQQRVGSVPLYRYWNAGIGDHFYTTNWGELGSGDHGWRYEQIQCYVYPTQIAGTIPLYRYWNPTIGDHFYTTNWGELGSGRDGWRYESVQCYVFGQPSSPPVGERGDAAEMLGPSSAPTTDRPSTASSFTPAPAPPPSTFSMDMSAGPSSQDAIQRHEDSFVMSGEEVGHFSRMDSFTVVGAAKSRERVQRPSAVTVNVNVEGGSGGG